MNSRDLAVTIICSIWLISLIISGLLALAYQNKLVGYKQLKESYKKQIEELQNGYNLVNVEIHHQLKEGEVCHYFAQNQQVYFSVKRKKGSFEAIEANKDYKNYFKAKKLELTTANVYLTNKHVLLEFKDKYLKENIENISIVPYVFFYINSWIDGCEIIVKNQRFLIANNSAELIVAYKKLINRKEEN
ncbi:hypothetical protein SCHIN_v1c07220 [Spiroplasma chinense]|uniref:Uncharacterized protein n=1 Tax=Spiroplasma chinense TaxID=216932 RepID=A0A5B9Y6M8_9MOLU|nr:hypothetical protein [Spiroplasma chinense]QEH61917.1 hypothetical protein SCHIN_v1c07220 [Spiroplasma chinense]